MIKENFFVTYTGVINLLGNASLFLYQKVHLIWPKLILKHSHDLFIQMALSHHNQKNFRTLTPVIKQMLCTMRWPSLFVSCCGHADWMQSGKWSSCREKFNDLRVAQKSQCDLALKVVGAYWKDVGLFRGDWKALYRKIHRACADSALWIRLIVKLISRAL